MIHKVESDSKIADIQYYLHCKPNQKFRPMKLQQNIKLQNIKIIHVSGLVKPIPCKGSEWKPNIITVFFFLKRVGKLIYYL